MGIGAGGAIGLCIVGKTVVLRGASLAREALEGLDPEARVRGAIMHRPV